MALVSHLFGCAALTGPTQKTRTVSDLDIAFVKIKGGSFQMGDNSGNGVRFERPVHEVTVPDFYISRYEITFEQYDRYAHSAGRPNPDDAGWGRGQRPVINVSWREAQHFAQWLSEQTGKTIRLPTEAEWEYAARAGSNTAYWWGSEMIAGHANCQNCESRWSGAKTAPVGSFPANPFGLHDMHGNVYEWCLDNRHMDYVGAPADGSAWRNDKGRFHITRGGSWNRTAYEARSSSRSWEPEGFADSELGIRLVMEE